MRRIALISILCFALLPSRLHSGSPAGFYIESEYRRDSIDYSEAEKYFYREKLSVQFSRESAFNLGLVYIEQDEEKRYTWSLALNDISPYFAFVLGNYYVNFGYGLLIGRKTAYEPDLFSNRAGGENHNLFIPCKSGNPLYTFSGIGGSFSKKIINIDISLNIFYSINERFAGEEAYESGYIESGIDTIDGKYNKTLNSSEPVYICTNGGMLFLRDMDALSLQIFYIFTGIRSRQRNDIHWDSYDTYYGRYGTSSLLGNGFLLEYRDDYLKVFCEGDMTVKETAINTNHKEDIKGYGLLYGIVFRPPFLTMSVAGKEMDGNYYSPYSSSIGEDHPEDAFFLDTEIRPFLNLKAGAGLSSQRKTAAGSRDDAAPVTERQKIYLNYNLGRLEEFSVTARRMERSDEDGRAEKYQLKEKAGFKLHKSLKLEAQSIFQKSRYDGYSAVYEGGLKASFLSKLQGSVYYASAKISGDNYIYTVICPVPNSSAPGIMISEDSNIIITKLDFKYKDLLLSCRYLYQYYHSAALHRRFEFFASGKF